MNINTNTILTKHANQSLYKENSKNGDNLPQLQTFSKVKKSPSPKESTKR